MQLEDKSQNFTNTQTILLCILTNVHMHAGTPYFTSLPGATSYSKSLKENICRLLKQYKLGYARYSCQWPNQQLWCFSMC